MRVNIRPLRSHSIRSDYKIIYFDYEGHLKHSLLPIHFCRYKITSLDNGFYLENDKNVITIQLFYKFSS
jgi:hypothetical protein